MPNYDTEFGTNPNFCWIRRYLYRMESGKNQDLKLRTVSRERKEGAKTLTTINKTGKELEGEKEIGLK